MLGSAFAEALGDRAGIARFGDARVPDGRVRGRRRGRHRWATLRGRRPAVPRRAGRRAAAPARRACHRGVRADRRRDRPRLGDRPQRPPPGRGRLQGPRTGTAGRDAPRIRAGPASPRPRDRSDDSPLRVAVADYGAGNLVSIGRALETVGAVARSCATRRGWTRRTPSSCPASVPRPRRWPASSGRARRADPELGRGRPAVPGDLPRPPAPVRGQRRGRRRDPRPAGRPHGRPADAPTLPHIGWNQVQQRREHPLLAGVPDGADLYFVHSFVGGSGGPRRRSWPRPPMARRSRA